MFWTILLLGAHATAPFGPPQRVGDRGTGIVGTGDFNADGAVDVVYSRNGGFQWYAGPDFDGTADEYDLGPGSGTSYGGTTADINGDGWPDVVVSDGARSAGPGALWVFLHPGNPVDALLPWPRITVYTQDVWHQNDLDVADMDGDGRLDIVVRTRSDDERLLVALQNPDINTWTTRFWATGETSNTPEGLGLGDLDNDGEVEIVLSGVYWDNPGGWRTGDPVEHMIDPDFVGLAIKAVVADFDQDGQADDVAICKAESGSADQTLSWYRHDGNPTGGASSWIETVLESGVTDMHTLEVGDFDLDGRTDILAARSFQRQDILMYFGAPLGTPFTRQLIDTGKMYVASVVDLDLDGDLDFVGPATWQGAVFAYENLLLDGSTTPPDAPSSLVASTASDTSITLQWVDGSGNEAGFEIERAIGAGVLQPLTTVPANTTTWTDAGLTPDTLHRYRVRATNGAGASDWAMEASARTDPPPPPDTDPPSVPTGLTATRVTDRRIDLMWSPSTDDRGVTGYRVWVDGVLTASPTDASVALTSLLPDRPYSLTVQATDAAGNLSAASAPLVVQTEPEPDLLDGQLAHWTLDDNTGGVAQDESGTWDGSLSTGVTWGEGPRMGAALFDGSGRIDLGAVDTGPLTELTLATWVRVDSLAGFADEARFISRATSTTGNDHLWMLGNYGDGTALRFRLDTGGAVTTLQSADGVLTPGTWAHVAATWDGTQMRLFKDGVPVATLAAAGTVPAAPGVTAALGNQPAGAGDRGLVGALDDVHLFDRALTVDDLVSLAAGPPCADADADGLCDTEDFGLSQTAIVPQQPMTFTAERAQPGARVSFLVSGSLGTPTCHPVATSVCTELSRPIVVGTAIADGAGTATLTVTVPRLPAGFTVYSQAAWFDGPAGDVTPLLSTASQ